MGAQHTPGPWKATRCGELYPDRWNVIALLPTKEGHPQNIRTIDQVLDYCGALEAEANARLIAAAPDLLEVVEAMANFDGRNNNAALKQMARTAIAKARGKE